MSSGPIVAEEGAYATAATAAAATGVASAVQATGPTLLDGLAEALAAVLPPGSHVVVHWRDAVCGEGLSAVEGASHALRANAARCISNPAESVNGGSEIAWDDGQARMVVVATLAKPQPAGVMEAWRGLARRTVEASLAAARAQAQVASLRKSQRLQQALYEIADLAGSGLEMDEMLGRIHEVVGGLMYALNFFIVLYDAATRTIRFLYFADALDPYMAQPDLEISIDELPNSLTVALLHGGLPLQGPSEQLRRALGVKRDLAHGPDSADWLGVPMWRDDRVSGAIVVQSYDRPGMYSDEDRALLEYVAQHIQTALDRKHAQVELERRVYERTLELQQANLVLQAEIVERQRAERLQRALYKITELSVTTGSLERFYAEVHNLVGELLYARNFYIALLTTDGEQIEFPYSVDERDSLRITRKRGTGLTEYVITHGVALLADRARIADLEAAGSVRSHGSHAQSWLGVPLVRDGMVVGAIAVQSYTPDIVFTPRDQELLTFVAHHIGAGLARKRTQEHLKAAHSELEFRVESRTQELAGANRELRAQIGERMRAEQRLTHQARHDALTGLPNRPHLLERLDDAISKARSREGACFGVLFLDLDRFKLINDSIGHAAGDEMLVEVGRRIAAVLGDTGVVARFGGDEFAILADPLDGPDASEALATRILEALGKPLWIGGRELFPSASIGIALWQPRYRLGEELLRDADAAMYRAKAEGRDRSALFDEAMRAHAIRLLDLEADLRRAILGDSFVPHFQPIVRLTDGAIVGHEALLRWNHDLHGPLPPGEFVGVGEDSGLIEQVDWLLYERVIGWLHSHPEGYVSINVSPRHFRSDDFAERLLRMLDDARADPHRLRIEITEVALLDDAPRALRMLNVLRQHGVLALLDDFGTGFSALSYLHRFPIQALKIDRSFVAGLDGETRAESLALVRAILALANTLGIDTIGEGIETVVQRDTLAELGCGYGQGYLLGTPEAQAMRGNVPLDA
ncbi:sensor domain-containing diguanylate cyclase [Cognatiluteimonas telluris]|uniref:sensor domain-containing diguanylate cyclase n=1 Tax=Cognatiluteimonas telluris TaxID=1104775 RepID=UPI0014093EA7|nr:EAL domain-containing protein [Lysobacter telluris]